MSNRGVAREVGISFTPVREALSRLVSEGLLEYRQGIGVFVPIINAQEIRESYELREILESEVAARIAKNPPSSMLSEMTESYECMVDMAAKLPEDECNESFDSLVSAWQTADLMFHVTLLRASGNRCLVNTLEGLRISMEAMMVSTMKIMPESAQGALKLIGHRFSPELHEQMERVLDEHHSIIEALKQGDSNSAKEIVVKHIRTGLEEVLGAYHQNHMGGSGFCLRRACTYG